MSSLLWRSAAAAAGRQLGRPPSARTTIRSMASSCSSSSENMRGTSWLIIANFVVVSAWIQVLNNRSKAHTEEMRSVRQEIQRLQASNTELEDQLKRDLTRRRARNRAN